MIIVYAGSQVDETGREVPRLPVDATEELTIRLRGLIQSLKPSLVVGALASGADIIFARAALAENTPVRAVLPFSTADFRRTSVESRGEPWTGHYDRLIDNPQVEVFEGNQKVEETAEAFIAHNLAILDSASTAAELTGESIWVITIRPTPTPGSPSVTDDLVARAEDRGHLTIDLNPIRQRTTAFVVMPYGKKRDARTGRYLECDPAFHKVYRPLLEDADVVWTRADLETDSGIIHSSMLASLANSDIALVDLATTNFNVAYELGVRHVFAAHSTILVNPHVLGSPRQTPPFDVNMIRVHSYSRDADLSDQQAEDAIRQLKPVLAEAIADRTIDSPAHDWFQLDHVARPFAQRSAIPDTVRRAVEARQRISNAIRSSDAVPMLAEAAWLETAPEIPEDVRRALRIELAVALLDEASYAEAHALLDLAQPTMDDPLHRLWLQTRVMACRRLGEQTADPSEKQELWRTARNLLLDAELAGYADSETYGIWGGLIKRQLQDEQSSDDPAVVNSLFQEMAEKYKAGFELDPNFYTGVNLVMALRLGNRERDTSFRDELNEAITVTRFLNRLALANDPTDFWALVTRAELSLYEALEHNGEIDIAAQQYAEAVRYGRPGPISIATFQLEFLGSHGAPDDVISRLTKILNPARKEFDQ
ncbi:tetratricopeptide repeat-containing protein [Rhodococcus baikonurensis]|uniref:Tetratricopeptide repeat-containing protein n=1 Tax=Rhodococcus baikonurensis TaxID=172041 RepID=A0ABV5XM28_9NOCA